MPKAFWLFAKRDGTGSTPDDAYRPHLPAAFGGRMTNPGDIIRFGNPVAGPAHRHLVVGGIGLPDDNIGDGHRHYAIRVDTTWHQATVGAADHTHNLPIGTANQLVPDFYMLFVACSNADAIDINNDPDCYPIVEAELTQDAQGNWSIGDLDNTPWTAGEETTWRTRSLNILRLDLPAEVDRGRRLVLLFLGALLSRDASNERNYRFT